MSSRGDRYSRRTLEFVERVAAARTVEEVRELTKRELDWYGLTFVTSWSIPASVENFANTVTMNTRPQSYVDHYNETGLVSRDPVVTHMRSSMKSLSWSDVRERDLSKAERKIVDEGRDFGATDGLTIPVISKDGCLGVFSPCGQKPDLSPRARAALEVVGIYAHQSLERFVVRKGRGQSSAVRLTPREREVMRWVALGKTNDEIGAILGVERTTIKTMLSRAQEKLGATCRTYAVVQALRLGELNLNF